jgi:hypothetical protein
MSTPSLRLEALLLAKLTTAAEELIRGGGAVTVDGVSYTEANQETLFDLVRMQRIRAAIEAIEGGAQSYSIDGRSLTRAALPELYARLNELERRAAAQARGGAIRFVQLVPGS